MVFELISTRFFAALAVLVNPNKMLQNSMIFDLSLAPQFLNKRSNILTQFPFHIWKSQEKKSLKVSHYG